MQLFAIFFSLLCVLTLYDTFAAVNGVDIHLEKIILGAIFEQGNEEIQSAFKFAIVTHNKNISGQRFELQAFVDVINTADAFKLSRLICGQFGRGIRSLIGAVGSESFSILHSYSNTFQVPFITPWFPEKVRTPLSRSVDHALSMRPEYHQAVIDTINFYGWRKIIFIYQNDDGLLRLQQLYQKSTPENRSFKIDFVRKIQTAQDAISFLINIEAVDRWGNKFIVLDCSAEMAKEIVINHVRCVSLGKRTYHYLLSGLVMDDRWESEITEYGAINITGFRIIDDDRAMLREFYRNWSHFDISSKDHMRQSISAEAALMHDAVYVLVEGFTKLLRKKPDIFRGAKKNVDNSSMMSTLDVNNGSVVDCSSSKGWITPWEHGDKISRFLRKVEIEGLTGTIQFNEGGRRENYTLYVVEMTIKRALTKIAEWTDKDGLKLRNTTHERLQGPIIQRNRTYIVTTVLDEPYMMLKKPKDGEMLDGNDRYEGYCKDIADYIFKTMGINYELILVKDGKYGSENDQVEGGWDGMIGELIRNEADVAIAPLTITISRERVVDFSKPFASIGLSVMMKKPSKIVPNVLYFLEPLSKEVWLCVIISFVAVSIVLFIVSRFSSSEWHIISQDQQYYYIPRNHCLESPTSRHSVHNMQFANHPTILINDFSILNCFWFTVGTFLQQGCNLTPRSLSGRVMSIFWWLFTLTLLITYTANLTAFFTMQRIFIPVNSVEDLVAQGDIEYGTIKDSSIWKFFQKSQVPLHRKIWESMNSKRHVMVRNYEEGVQRVRNSKGKYAFLIDSIKNEYINRKHPCNTVKVGRNLYNEAYGIAIANGSPIKESVNYAVLSLLESGELAEIEHRWSSEQSECGLPDKQGENAKNSLTLTHLAGAFYVLVAGMILAMMLALMEFYYKSRTSSYSSKIMFDHMSFHNKIKPSQNMMIDNAKYENLRTKEILHQYYGRTNHLDGIEPSQILNNSHTEV